MNSYKLLLLLLIITACNTSHNGYKFKINAVYEAPVSGFKMTIESNGYVEPGSDMAETYEGSVFIEPIPEKESIKKINLNFSSSSDELLYDFDSGKQNKVVWGFREDFKSLIRILGLAGYKNLSEDEIRESVAAFGGTLSGPKGVILEGQSEYIKVIKVDYGDKNN